MRWIKATVLYGVPDNVADDWDEMGSFNFSAWPLHNPDKHQYVISQDSGFTQQEEAEKIMFSFFTEDGGI